MLKKIIIFSLLSQSIIFADAQSDATRLAEIKKELGIVEPTAKEKKLEALRAELGISYDKPQKEGLFLSHNKKEEKIKPKKDNSLGGVFGSIQDSISESVDVDLDIDKELDSFSLDKSMRELKRTFEIEEGESYGLPSILGLNKKQDNSILGLDFLGDIKDSGDTMYKGFKYSGESAEFMSGMMYYNSKVYNTMFGVFEDSPFNIFEEEETSLLDVFEGGNSILDMFN